MEQLTNCTIFLTIWMASIGSRGIFHIGLIFCRLTLYEYFFFSIKNHFSISRFIYVRYATGLLEDGISLLHWATIIFISFFSFHIMLIHPIKCCLFFSYKKSSSRVYNENTTFITLVNELDDSLGSAVQAVVKFIYQRV